MQSEEPPPKKHKKHKKDKDRDRHGHDDGEQGTPVSTNARLKLILRVGGSSTPEHSDSPAPSLPHILNVPYDDDSRHSGSQLIAHKKSKKKEKKRKKEKKHRHKEKRRREREEALLLKESSNIQEQLRSEPPIIPLDVTLPEDILPMPPSPKISTQTQSEEQVAGMAAQTQVVDENSEPSLATLTVPPIIIHPASATSQPQTPRRPLDNKCLKKLLEHLVRALEKKDSQQFFAWPVTDRIAPGYSSIISTPMDFSTMKSKVDREEYSTLADFTADFKLMCENAMIYNHMDTIYYKAAKKLLLGGIKMLEPEKIRALLPLIPSIRLLQEEQIGFKLLLEPVQPDGVDILSLSEDDSQENLCFDPTQSEHYMPPHPNDPPDLCGAFTEDLTTQEVLQQARLAAREAAHRLATKKPNRKMGFLRQKPDGSTSLSILLPSNGFKPGQEVPMSLGAFTGKIQHGTSQLLVAKEDRKNFQRAAKPLHYGSFSSFAPTRDSSFSALSEDESNLLSSVYGESREYAESLIEFSRGCDYTTQMVDGILDTITHGEHSKTINLIEERQRMETERAELLRKEEEFAKLEAEEAMYLERMGFPSCAAKEENSYAVQSADDLNLESLTSLNDLGIETGFLNEVKQTVDSSSRLDKKLSETADLLGGLQKAQKERFAQPVLPMAPYVYPPTETEVNIANKVVENLVELAKDVPPAHVVSSDSLHKAMGIDLDAFGYEPPPSPVAGAEITDNGIQESQLVPMETDTGTMECVEASIEQGAASGNEQELCENMEEGTEGKDEPETFPISTSDEITP